MPRGWPPLELREVLAILAALGLSYSHSKGGHDFYKGKRNGVPCSVTVDSKCAPFSVDLLQSMVVMSFGNTDALRAEALALRVPLDCVFRL